MTHPEKFPEEKVPEKYLALYWDNVAKIKSLFEQFWSLKVFQELSFLGIFGHIRKFLNIAFPQKDPIMSQETLDDIQGQHLGRTQSFSLQIFSNVALTSAYVVLL